MALTKDGAVVNRILTAVGCVTISQVCALFPDKSDKAIRYILSRLYHEGRISFLENNFIVPFRSGSLSRSGILSAWVMLDTDPDANIGINTSDPLELEMVGPTDYPCLFMYVHNNILYDVLYIHEDNLANLLYMKRSIQNRLDTDELDHYSLLIVVEDEDLLSKISEININVPVTIAVVSSKENLWERPDIVFYQ